MPDLLSHVLFILIACELVNFKKKGLLLFGAILPDIVAKIVLFGFIVKLPKELASTLIVLHSPIPLFFLIILIGLFFKDFFSAVYLIGVGGLSHILLDCLNAHYLYGIRLLFPFSWNYYRINLFWPDQYLWVLIPLLTMYLFIKVYKLFKQK